MLQNSVGYYRQVKLKLKQDGIWCDVDMQNISILEIYFPVELLVVKAACADLEQKEFVVECTIESTTQLLALAVDHIDILLEDWYPTLGTRFVHTSEGKFLVTRLVPCPKCLQSIDDIEQHMHEQNHCGSKNLLDVCTINFLV